MMHTRAVAMPLLQANDIGGAIQQIEDGLELIRAFYREHDRGDLLEESNEVASLQDWLQDEVRVQILDYRERLKFQYFFPLVDQWLKQQEAGLEDTLGSLLGSLSGLTTSVHLEETERQAREQRLEELIPTVQAAELRLSEPAA